jgi:membrane-associated protease RseP (regulator of RpoE activity)
MKKIIFLLIFLHGTFLAFSQGEMTSICHFGFTFEVSRQESWGYAKPVILTVTPNTSADAGGLKINDIIESIDGKSTEGQMIDTITFWLQNSLKEKVELKVSSLKEKNKDLTLTRYCRLSNAIVEKDLASVYSFYSLEDTQNRAFTCPFKTVADSKSNLLNFKTFGFSPVDPDNRKLETEINAVIRKSLEQKGLTYSAVNPDLVVQNYYSYNKNLNYRNSDNSDKLPLVNRYNVQTGNMEKLLIYFDPLIHPNQARYFLKLGIRLVDRKANQKVVWECEANELIQSGEYVLNTYAEFHIPLMLMQYPYIKSAETASFYYSCTKYNYTGINYNMDKLNEIIDVDYSSPAVKSELRPGDIIEKINGIKVNTKLKSVDSNYKQFIFRTMPLRDASTQFTNAEGFTKCMYWDKLKYAQIYDAFRKQEFSAVFSYLFYFEPYINLGGTNIITFSVIRGKEKEEIKVTPVVVTEVVFENK